MHRASSQSLDCSIGQLGRIVGVKRHVYLETNSGDIIEDVNTKQLSRVGSSVSGDCMVMGPWIWIGRAIRAWCSAMGQSVKCCQGTEVLKHIHLIIFQDAPYFHYPSQHVRIVHPAVSKSATWLSG